MSLLSLIQTAIELIANANAEPKQPTAAEPENKIAIAKVNNISKLGLMELASYEGLANYPYLDSVGVKTIGIGLTRTDVPDIAKLPWDTFISDRDCVQMFAEKVQHYVDALNGELKVAVKQHEFDALVSITYNIGTGNTKLDKGGMAGSTFIDLVNAKADPKKIVAAMAMWNKGTIGGKRVVIKGLTNRRAKEADLYLTGNYKSNGRVARIIVNPTTHKPAYSGFVNIEGLV